MNATLDALVAERQREGARRIVWVALAACAISTPFCVGILLALDRRLGAHLLILIGALSLFELAQLALVRRGLDPPWLHWANSAVEVSMPAVIALIDYARIGPAYALTSAPVMLYGLVVLLSVLRLRPRVVLFAGALGALELAALALWLQPKIPAELVRELPSLSLSNCLQRAAYVLLAGLVAYFLCKSLLRLASDALAQLAARAEADRARLASEEQYRALTENSADLILRIGREGRLLFANRAAQGLLGAAPQALAGQELCALEGPAAPLRALSEDVEAVLAGGGERDRELELPGPRARWLECRLVPELGGSGAVETVLATLHEVSARKRAEQQRKALEEQLRHAQKMEAVGQLAGGVAHDFNNILTAIVGNAAAVLEELPPEAPHRADLEEIRAAGQRAAGLTRQLLAFSRRQVIAPRVIEINPLVEAARAMLARIIGEGIELRFLPGEGLGRVRVDPGQLEQVLLNLAVNARDAMPGGGLLTLATAEETIDAAATGLPEGLRPGRYVTLAVSDTGTGIAPEARARLFEPFFTTKALGRGTGLGLSTVWGIVRQSDGAIAVESESGRGSTFRVYLPRLEQPADAPAPPRPRPAPGGGETVLVVEDEAMLRALVRRVLRRGGYEVLEAPGGKAGLERCRSYPGRIDLLVTDVVMPGMSGKALWDAAARARPGMRVLFLSGYSDDILGAHGVLAADTPLLAKPFEPEALLERVRAALDGPAALSGDPLLEAQRRQAEQA